MRKIDDGLLDELLKGCERPEDLLGDGGLMRDLKKALMQRMLGAELTEHLGYEHGHEPPPVQTNRRNGVSRKTLRSEDGLLEIAVPRDREGSFEPQLIAKGQTRLDGLDDKIIALYARGMSVRDIRGHLEELLSYEFRRLPRQKGATARHAIYGGQWRGSDREKLGRLWRRAVVGSPPSSSSVLNGYSGSRPE